MTTDSKRKRFGVPTIASQDVAHLLTEVADDGAATIEPVALSRIDFDPDQPRRLGLSRSNPRAIASNDSVLQGQLDALEDLAASIKSMGVIEPIGVYRRGDRFILAWGERRVMAAELNGMTAIRAEILPSRPKELRAKQLAENMARQALTLHERVNGYMAFLSERASEGRAVTNADEFADIVGLRRTRAYGYFALTNAPEDVRKAIASGALSNMHTAYRVCSINDPVERAQAIAAIAAGQTPGAQESAPVAEAPAPVRAVKRVGRPINSINLGKQSDGNVVRFMVERLLDKRQFENYRTANWNDLRVASDIWKQVLKKIEQQLGAPDK